MVYQRGMEEKVITTLLGPRPVRTLQILKGSGMKARSSLKTILKFEYILLLWALYLVFE